MRKENKGFLLVAILLLFFTMAMAGGSGIDLSWHHFPGGAGHIAAGSYTLDSSIGMPVVGQAQSGALTLCTGFWCIQGPPVLGQRLYLPAVVHKAP